MNKPVVSVLVPFYNAAQFLDVTITSIITQTLTNWELILINDGSTDNSDAVVQKYLGDKRIIYIKNPKRLTQIPNLNHGLKIAKAELIARLDGDDVAYPQRLQQQYDYMLAHPDIALVGSFIDLIDEKGKIIQKVIKPTGHASIQKVCFYYSPFAHPAIMFRRDVVRKLGDYRPTYTNREDIDLYFRLIYSGHKTDNIPEYLTQYRQHAGNVSKFTRQNGLTSWKLKRNAIKQFQLKLSAMEVASMYVHFCLDMTLSHHQKTRVELLVKKVMVNRSGRTNTS